MKMRFKNHEFPPDNCTGIAEWEDGEKRWYVNGKRHRIDGPAVEYLSGYKSYYVDGICVPEIFGLDNTTHLFLGKEKGKYDLEWLKFMTEKGIEEYPIIPGMETEEHFKMFFIEEK